MAISELFTNQAADVIVDGVDPSKTDMREYLGLVERYVHGLLESFSSVLVNGRLDVSVDSNVLTIAIKTALGADPSSSDPVHIRFRDADDGGDEIDRIAITSALSVTVDAGADLGTSSGVAFRVWVVAFNDSGTIRLGVVNLYSGSNIFALSELEKKTSTALSASADSAGTIYTDTAVATARPIRILGCLTWDDGVTTAGLWDSAPSEVHHAGPMTPYPGAILQDQTHLDANVATGSNNLALDDSTPLISEGTEVMEDIITPTSPANLCRVSVSIAAALSAAGTLIGWLARDSTVVLARSVDVAGAADTVLINLEYTAKFDQATAITWNVRLGSSTGTYTFNGSGGSRTFGGVNVSSISVKEIFL